MNLSKFLTSVDSLSQSMEKKQLTDFVHDIARMFPENSRDDFLDRLKKYICDKDIASSRIRNEYTEEVKIIMRESKRN